MAPPIALGLRGLGVGPRGGTYLYFDGLNDFIDCGSDASLDDLPSGSILTVDGWFRYDNLASWTAIASKGAMASSLGWHVRIATNEAVQLEVYLATTGVIASSTKTVADALWHHFVCFYNDATKTGRVAVDAQWGSPHTGAGAYQADAANNLILGRRSTATTNYLKGGLSWIRLSNNDRYGGATGNPFSFPGRINPPAKDGNTIEMWYLNEGAGLVTKARVTSPTNDGAITGATWMRG